MGGYGEYYVFFGILHIKEQLLLRQLIGFDELQREAHNPNLRHPQILGIFHNIHPRRHIQIRTDPPRPHHLIIIGIILQQLPLYRHPTGPLNRILNYKQLQRRIRRPNHILIGLSLPIRFGLLFGPQTKRVFDFVEVELAAGDAVDLKHVLFGDEGTLEGGDAAGTQATVDLELGLGELVGFQHEVEVAVDLLELDGEALTVLEDAEEEEFVVDGVDFDEVEVDLLGEVVHF